MYIVHNSVKVDHKGVLDNEALDNLGVEYTCHADITVFSRDYLHFLSRVYQHCQLADAIPIETG